MGSGESLDGWTCCGKSRCSRRHVGIFETTISRVLMMSTRSTDFRETARHPIPAPYGDSPKPNNVNVVAEFGLQVPLETEPLRRRWTNLRPLQRTFGLFRNQHPENWVHCTFFSRENWCSPPVGTQVFGCSHPIGFMFCSITIVTYWSVNDSNFVAKSAADHLMLFRISSWWLQYKQLSGETCLFHQVANMSACVLRPELIVKILLNDLWIPRRTRRICVFLVTLKVLVGTALTQRLKLWLRPWPRIVLNHFFNRLLIKIDQTSHRSSREACRTIEQSSEQMVLVWTKLGPSTAQFRCLLSLDPMPGTILPARFPWSEALLPYISKF